MVGRAIWEGAVGWYAEFLALRGDVGEVDWFGFVGEVFVVEGVAGFPRVGCEGVVRRRGGYVVEDDGLGGGGVGVLLGGTHVGGLRWGVGLLLGCWKKRVGVWL